MGRVFWDDWRRVLTVTGVGSGGAWWKELVLPSHTALAELARERVTSTLLASTAVRDSDQFYAWVTARSHARNVSAQRPPCGACAGARSPGSD